MLFAVLYLALGTLAAACQADGDHVATCQTGKCEIVDSAEICTQCKAGGVPIDGFCRPVGSPRVIIAGCTGPEDAPLDKATTTCGRCSGADHFLFMGGCYNQKVGVGSVICTAASGGECNTCAKAGWLFENPAESPAPGTKCILCSDVNGDGKAKGVADCATCQAPGSSPGVATCDICRTGYVKKGDTCVQCQGNCATCENTENQCTSCKAGFYLKANQCDADCGSGKYVDKTDRTCKACDTTISSCTACEYVDKIDGPKCSSCGNKMIKTEVDGTTTCVDAAACAKLNTEGTHFLNQNKDKCILCSIIEGSPPDQGQAECNKCKKERDDAVPTCTECLPGFYLDGTCKACGANCATCTQVGDDQCTACKSGYFVKDNGIGTCVPCDDQKNGIDGCATCTFAGSLTCDTCKPNYASKTALRGVACRKTCEDETACGGTAGACNAIVVGADGKGMNYCSYCGGADDVPIDGRCVNKANANGNTECTAHKCPSCTAADYFLYMGGCYSTKKEPGNLICTEAKDGKCIAPTSRYFAVPGAAKTGQSVLACGNPLGTAVGDKTYVGVEGCSQCTAPAQLEASGMAAATCTACGEGRKPSKSGTGCAVCSDANCRHCRVDGVCEECSTGFNLEGGKCVSTGGPNLSTGAIAGISVAVVVVVGGLVVFLCWWFICRGKA